MDARASSSRSSTRDSVGAEARASSIDPAEKAIRSFAHSILHGDKAHKDWLLAAAEAFIAGKKPPTPPAKPKLTVEQIAKRYAPPGGCPWCERRRKADGIP